MVSVCRCAFFYIHLIAVAGPGGDIVHQGAFDRVNNELVICGWYGTADMRMNDAVGPGGVDLIPSSGPFFGFIGRYFANGTAKWAIVLNLTSGGARVWGVAIDSVGNAVGAGFFSGTINIVNSVGTVVYTSTAVGGNDAFVMSTAANGSFNWFAMINGSTTDWAFSCAVDSSNNVIAQGYSVSALIDVYHANGTRALTLTAIPQSRFVVKYSQSGVVQWAVRSP
jgi:hypothetical protein